jgi:F0F1-type ATP synthase membrane subunit c/vacuolar-type H+-ATPase subunit K
MKYIAIILGILFGSFSCALAQSNSGGSAAGQTSTSSSTVQGTAGTNVGGTVHTNQATSLATARQVRRPQA